MIHKYPVACTSVMRLNVILMSINSMDTNPFSGLEDTVNKPKLESKLMATSHKPTPAPAPTP